MAGWLARQKNTGGAKLSQVITAAQKQEATSLRDEHYGSELAYSEPEDEEEHELLGVDSSSEGQSSEGSVQVLCEVQAISNFLAIEDSDLGFKDKEILFVLETSREDGWLLAQNALGERGYVPSNYVQRISPGGDRVKTPTPSVGVGSVSPRRGRDLWSKLKQNVNQTSLADVLSAMGAIPSGFRESTLSKLLAESRNHLSSSCVVPHLSHTGMAFKHLHWDFVRDQLKPEPVKVTREFSLLAAKMIPLPGKGVRVLSRHVRVALFNKNDILGNVHTVRAVWIPTEEKTWKFAPRAQSSIDSLLHPVGVVRMDSQDAKLELLFELGVTFRREKTGDVGELSCGWGSLPLFDLSGNPTQNRTYELKVNGGTPFESGVELDSARKLKASGSLIPAVLRANQTPRLYVRLSSIPRAKKMSYDLLPPAIITSSLYTPLLGCFRYLVAVAFLRGRMGLPLESSVAKPALNVFTWAVDQPDVMDTLLTMFNERMKLAKRSDKGSLRFASEQLETILLQTIYPLLSLYKFPRQLWADDAREKERLRLVEEFSKKTNLGSLLAVDSVQNCMDMSEQVFSIYP